MKTSSSQNRLRIVQCRGVKYLHSDKRRVALMRELHVVVCRFDNPILCGRHKMNGTGLHRDFVVSIEFHFVFSAPSIDK